MTIDDIDFAQLYRAHLAQAERTRKDPEHWDKRAEKMAQNCANPADPYLIRFKEIVDTTGAKTLLDVGCGRALSRCSWQTALSRSPVLITAKGC